MERQTPVVHSHPEILGSIPVFIGTRVPLPNLIDYLEHGHTLDAFASVSHSPGSWKVTRSRATSGILLALS